MIQMDVVWRGYISFCSYKPTLVKANLKKTVVTAKESIRKKTSLIDASLQKITYSNSRIVRPGTRKIDQPHDDALNG